MTNTPCDLCCIHMCEYGCNYELFIGIYFIIAIHISFNSILNTSHKVDAIWLLNVALLATSVTLYLSILLWN